MTDLAPRTAPIVPWRDARFWIPVALIPITSFVALLFWQYDASYAMRVVQLCLGWTVLAQMVVVIFRVFERGWFEFFAYLIHLIMIGIASLTVTFRLELYPPGLLYDQLAVMGLAGQLMLGMLTLGSGPLRVQARLDPVMLAICSTIVCGAAMAKFWFYLQYVGVSGLHVTIYTEGDAVRDNSPFVVRVLAAGAPLIGLLALTQPGLPKWCRALGAIAIILEFVIGIRGRPLYIMLAAVAMTQASLRVTAVRKLLLIACGVLGVILLAAIGYYREANFSTADEYFWMIIESLFGIFEAGVLSTQLPEARELVVTQIGPLVAPTPLGSIDTLSKLISSTYTAKAYALGYGYSSSALAEIVLLVGPALASALYPLGVLGIIMMIKGALTSRHHWLFLYGACISPIAYYIWRAELWQLALPAIKALPFIAVLLGADAFARLAKPKVIPPLLPQSMTKPFR